MCHPPFTRWLFLGEPWGPRRCGRQLEDCSQGTGGLYCLSRHPAWAGHSLVLHMGPVSKPVSWAWLPPSLPLTGAVRGCQENPLFSCRLFWATPGPRKQLTYVMPWRGLEVVLSWNSEQRFWRLHDFIRPSLTSLLGWQRWLSSLALPDGSACPEASIPSHGDHRPPAPEQESCVCRASPEIDLSCHPKGMLLHLGSLFGCYINRHPLAERKSQCQTATLWLSDPQSSPLSSLIPLCSWLPLCRGEGVGPDRGSCPEELKATQISEKCSIANKRECWFGR